MGRLDGRVAVVTGAARQRGIGRAIALRLAGEGARVTVSGLARSPESLPDHEREAGWRGLESVVEEIEAQGGRALAVECDVTESESVQALVEETVRAFGRLDILVNNAGLGRVGPPIVDLDDRDWFDVLDVNLNGTYFCSKAAARQMIAQGGGGSIVNFSSTAGRVGMPGYGAYTPAKFAVVGLTQMMALELAPHRITVNCVAPGSTDTDMMDGTFRRTAERSGITFEQMKQAVVQRIPLGRQGLPEDIAACVAFLVSQDASFVTGQTINVAGGPPFA